MTRWFRVYDDSINHPKVLKLSDRLHRIWLGLLCIASKNDGRLPSMEDCALMLRVQPERMAEALVSLIGARLLDRDETGLSPHNWAKRQYKSDSSADRMKRHRQRHRDVTVTAPEQNRENRTEAVTALVEVIDPAALAAWDDYGRQTTGKPYPRSKRGTWHFPTKWPPGHGATVHSPPKLERRCSQ
jgi:hypothetical protein